MPPPPTKAQPPLLDFERELLRRQSLPGGQRLLI
jgi:hypothetical protein